MLTILSPPATEPVSLDEAKVYLRVTHTLEDALIGALIVAAREWIETDLGVAMITTGLREEGSVDSSGGIALSRGPSITIGAAASAVRGAWSGVDPAVLKTRLENPPYRVDLPRGLVSAYLRLRVDYTAGYGADPAAVPPGLRQAILAVVAEAYAARDADPPAKPSLQAAEPWLAPFRRGRL